MNLDVQARYAIARARIELRLAELREALDRHEQSHRWDQHESLERVERGMAAMIEELR